MGNAGTVIALRAGDGDAPLRASHIGLARADPLKDPPNFHAYARLSKSGTSSSPMYVVLPSPTSSTGDRSAQLIGNSRTRSGQDRAAVEARTEEFLWWCSALSPVVVPRRTSVKAAPPHRSQLLCREGYQRTPC